MALYEKTDFSGGVVRDANEMAMPRNSMYDLRNVDPTRKAGALTLLKNVTKVVDVPQNLTAVIDNYVLWTIPGVGDYIVYIQDDGAIYYFDGTNVPTLIYTATFYVDGVSNLVVAGDSVYYIDNRLDQPLQGFDARVRIFYDYDEDQIEYEELAFTEKVYPDDYTSIPNSYTDSSGDLPVVFGPFTHRVLVTSILDGKNETFGFQRIISKRRVSPTALLPINKRSGFQGCRIYSSIGWFQSDDPTAVANGNIEDISLSPQHIYDIPAPSGDATDPEKKFYVPFLFHKANQVNTTSFRVYTYDNWSGSKLERNSPLGELLDLYNAGTKYIDAGHKVRIAGAEMTISTIVQTTNANETYYTITVTGDSCPDFSSEEGPDDDTVLIEIELTWVSNKTMIPIEYKHEQILGIPVDENRPDGGINQPFGRPVGFVKNRLLIGNPAWKKIDGQKEDNKSLGYITWSWITGDGLYALLTCPDINQIAPPSNASEMIAISELESDAIILQKNAVSRMSFQGDIPVIVQNKERGIQNRYQFYNSNKYFIIYSYGRVYLLLIDKSNYSQGSFRMVELSEAIATELESTSDTSGVRIVYDEYNDHVYITDINVNISTWICSLRRERPAWFRWSTNPVVAAFLLRGEQYYIIRAVDGSEDIFKRNASDEVSSSVLIQDHPFYSRLGNDFIRKIELLYKGGSSLTFELYIDDALVINHAMTSHTNVSIEEIVLPRTSQLRFNKFYWKISGNTSDGFEFHGIFINRDKYSEEAARGY